MSDVVVNQYLSIFLKQMKNIYTRKAWSRFNLDHAFNSFF